MVRKSSGQVMGGVVLVAVGAILLATRFVSLHGAPLWLLGLGVAFAFVAIIQKTRAPLVAGMILLGLGAGMVLGDRAVGGLHRSSWILIGLGLGFAAIYLLGLILQTKPHWWPLVPAAILLAVALAPIARTFTLIPPGFEEFVLTWWPAALVIAGGIVVYRALR